MSTLGEFTAIVTDEVNQGTRLASVIPTRIRMAARLIERNYSLLYMERFGEIELDVDADNARFIAWPTELVKKFNWLRYRVSTDISNQTSWKYLQRVEPIHITENRVSDPSAYWLTGEEGGSGYIVLDQVGTTDQTLELHYVQYTEWGSADGYTHWLLRNAEDALLAKTMQLLAPNANEPEWRESYKDMWNEGIRTLLMADEEARNAGEASGYAMVYK